MSLIFIYYSKSTISAAKMWKPAFEMVPIKTDDLCLLFPMKPCSFYMFTLMSSNDAVMWSASFYGLLMSMAASFSLHAFFIDPPPASFVGKKGSTNSPSLCESTHNMRPCTWKPHNHSHLVIEIWKVRGGGGRYLFLWLCILPPQSICLLNLSAPSPRRSRI